METSAKLYSLNYSNVKTYLFALLFVAGNIALPQLCHLVPYGGPTLLPIYFFTLIAAYKYGFRVGLLTAVLSPVINHVLFAMPSEAVLPIILIKSMFFNPFLFSPCSNRRQIPRPFPVRFIFLLGSASFCGLAVFFPKLFYFFGKKWSSAPVS